jgi:hypothetical protein
MEKIVEDISGLPNHGAISSTPSASSLDQLLTTELPILQHQERPRPTILYIQHDSTRETNKIIDLTQNEYTTKITT